MQNNCEIRIIRQVEPRDFIALYRDAGWWEEAFSTDFIQPLVAGSVVFAGAFFQDKMIGMGRAIGDACSDVYIQDVVVLREFRGCGIGTSIINTIICELRKLHIDWIGLIGEPGTQPFYEKLGFRLMKDHLPMKLETPPEIK